MHAVLCQAVGIHLTPSDDQYIVGCSATWHQSFMTTLVSRHWPSMYLLIYRQTRYVNGCCRLSYIYADDFAMPRFFHTRRYLGPTSMAPTNGRRHILWPSAYPSRFLLVSMHVRKTLLMKARGSTPQPDSQHTLRLLIVGVT
jgi:hypothetical protein